MDSFVILDDDWAVMPIPEADTIRVGAKGHHLTRDELPPDEGVWMRPSGVAEGRDTVVEAAVDWIGRGGPQGG